MGKTPVKVAVIGVGYLGRFHAQKFAGMDDADLLYCVDVEKDRADRAAEDNGARPAYDFREVLSEVDAVSIAVPTPAHFQVAKESLNAGCDILLEKPVTTTAEEAAELCRMAEELGRVYMPGHLERFNPPIMKLKDSVVKPAFIQAERLSGFKERAANIDVVTDLMIHDLDIVLSFVHSPIKRVSAIGVPVLSDKTDMANARIEFVSGAVANLTASRVSLGQQVRKIKIFQHESYISIDYQEQKMALFSLGEGDPDDPMSRIKVEEVPLESKDALEMEIKAFLHAVETREQPPVTAEDGRRALSTSLQILDCIERTPGPEDLA